MNFLAHLHIADITRTSAVGAIMGDFVKGQQWQGLPHNQQIGVLLHRQVDRFTDSHECVMQARRQFTITRQRYTGIVIDMLFDHLLARNWPQFHGETLAQFSQRQYQTLQASEPHWPAAMIQMCQRMTETDWLTSYREPETMSLALQRISRRMRISNPFSHAYDEWQQAESELESLFCQFYLDLLSQLPALQQRAELRQRERCRHGERPVTD